MSEIYSNCVVKLGQSVMSAIALALDVDVKVFADRIDKAFWNLRVVAYPGTQSDVEGFSGINQHTGREIVLNPNCGAWLTASQTLEF